MKERKEERNKGPHRNKEPDEAKLAHCAMQLQYLWCRVVKFIILIVAKCVTKTEHGETT